ncbi:MAG: hypothetical protein H6727_01295 [Myxococcales bacterium]|nr:hypothetical protein [Myxococcales bacterium]
MRYPFRTKMSFFFFLWALLFIVGGSQWSCQGTPPQEQTPQESTQEKASEKQVESASSEKNPETQEASPEEAALPDAQEADPTETSGETPNEVTNEPPPAEPSQEMLVEQTPDAGEIIPEPSPETTVEITPEAKKRTILVAVGYGGRRILSQDMGLTWQDNVELKAKGGDDKELLRCVTFGKDIFVTFGWRAFRSADGKNWTEFHRGWKETPPSPLEGVSGSNWRGGIAYGNGMFLAAGSSWASRSNDGTTWTTERVVGQTSVPATRRVLFGGGWFLLTGDSSLRVLTKDGQNWVGYATGGDNLKGAAYGAGRFVIIGENGRIITTQDGTTWPEQRLTTNPDLRSIVWTGTHFYIYAGGKVRHVSTDGLTWTQESLQNNPPSNMVYLQGHYIGYSWPGNLYHSSDGLTWTQTLKDDDNAITGITSGLVP